MSPSGFAKLTTIPHSASMQHGCQGLEPTRFPARPIDF